jgi:hypothetical protein
MKITDKVSRVFSSPRPGLACLDAMGWVTFFGSRGVPRCRTRKRTREQNLYQADDLPHAF